MLESTSTAPMQPRMRHDRSLLFLLRAFFCRGVLSDSSRAIDSGMQKSRFYLGGRNRAKLISNDALYGKRADLINRTEEGPKFSMERWFNCSKAKPQALLKLFCFPWAGGGSNHYAMKWSPLLPDSIEG